MKNKAHTATLNRICRRFEVTPGGDFDIQTDEMIIEVETSATAESAIDRLKAQGCPAYVALTNKEGIKQAVSKAQGTGVGIMDPKGDIVLEAGRASVGQPTLAVQAGVAN